MGQEFDRISHVVWPRKNNLSPSTRWFKAPGTRRRGSQLPLALQRSRIQLAVSVLRPPFLRSIRICRSRRSHNRCARCSFHVGTSEQPVTWKLIDPSNVVRACRLNPIRFSFSRCSVCFYRPVLFALGRSDRTGGTSRRGILGQGTRLRWYRCGLVLQTPTRAAGLLPLKNLQRNAWQERDALRILSPNHPNRKSS